MKIQQKERIIKYMIGDKIMLFKKGFKYQLEEKYSILTPIVGYDIDTTWVRLKPNGKLILREGFAWDGSSGPTIDTKTCKRASAEHDAFYRLMRYNELPRALRKQADILYHDRCLEDGMWKVKAWWRYRALRKAGIASTLPKNRKKIYHVPKRG